MRLKRHIRMVVAVITIAVVGAAVAAVGRSQSDHAQPLAVTVDPGAGTLVSIAASRRAAFERLGFRALRLIGTSNGLAFYRVEDSRDRACYAIGPAATVGEPGSVTCRLAPSPLIDWTYIEATRQSPEPRVYSASGITADAIASVALLDGLGRTIARAEVQNNVYVFNVVSPIRAASLVAFDASGARVFQRSIGRGSSS